MNYISAVSMKDGETKQMISAPDKVTGEILKIDVTLTLDPPKRAAIGLDRDHLANEFSSNERTAELKAQSLTTNSRPAPRHRQFSKNFRAGHREKLPKR